MTDDAYALKSIQTLAKLDPLTEIAGERMKEVALYDAKNGLSALVAEVERTGESVVITRHGKPAARLSAVGPENRGESRAAVARLLIEQLEQETPSVEGPSWPELKAEMDAERP